MGPPERETRRRAFTLENADNDIIAHLRHSTYQARRNVHPPPPPYRQLGQPETPPKFRAILHYRGLQSLKDLHTKLVLLSHRQGRTTRPSRGREGDGEMVSAPIAFSGVRQSTDLSSTLPRPLTLTLAQNPNPQLTSPLTGSKSGTKRPSAAPKTQAPPLKSPPHHSSPKP